MRLRSRLLSSAAVSAGCSTRPIPERADWSIGSLWAPSVGMWEPSYDLDRWRADHRLDLFLQRVGQGDAETQEEIAPQMVSILEARF